MLEPIVASVSMGYGHLRAADSLATAFGTEVVRVDGDEVANPAERALWRRARSAYEATTRLSTVPLLDRLLAPVVDAVTAIPPLHPSRDQSRATRATMTLDRMMERGLAAGIVAEVRRTGRPLVTTFYAPALAADAAGCPDVWCVVTDSDVHRIWAPGEPAKSRIRYLVPSERALRRLRAYGVPRAHILLTGFPLPPSLLGGRDLPALREGLAARLSRLDPNGAFTDRWGHLLEVALGSLPPATGPPLVTFAVGGAGAQAHLPERFLPGLAPMVKDGRLRLALVAGVRAEVAAAFRTAINRAGLVEGDGVEVLLETSHDDYFADFNTLLSRTDVLWTKPSELTFYGGLGLSLVLAPPVGVHERLNRRWARERGAGLEQRDPRHASEWLREALEDGTLAASAWSGFMNLPNRGTYAIVDAVASANRA